MNPTFYHTANASLVYFIENEFYNKGQAYKNYTSKLYYNYDPSLTSGYHAYSAPFKQWIYDQGVEGAWILSGVSGSANITKSITGMKVDYANGRVLVPSSYGTGLNISGSYAFKDLNLYLPNETQEGLLSNSKFTLNPRFGKYPNSGIVPYAMVTPAIFLTSETYENSQFDLAGMYETEARFSAVIMAENTWILDGALSLFGDMKRKSFPQLSPFSDPINEYGDIKAGDLAGSGVAEVSAFTFISDPEVWPYAGSGGQSLYFTIGVPTGQAYVYFGRDGAGPDPAPSGFVRSIVVDPGDIAYGTPAANRDSYAQAMVNALNFDPDLFATRIGDVVTITSRVVGPRADITLGTLTSLDASVAVITQGEGSSAIPSYNYTTIKQAYGTPGDQLMIKDIMASRLSDKLKINPNVFVGIVDFDVIKVRTLD